MTQQQDDAALVALREKLGGVEAEPFRGDNLVIFIASAFEPHVESEELDDSGTWKQEALDQAGVVLDAIHAHYAARITELSARHAELERDHVRQNAGQLGWLYHNPDTGTEWAEQHPVESGEVPDATDVMPGSAVHLHHHMICAWDDLRREEARADRLAKELDEAVKVIEPFAKAGELFWERDPDQFDMLIYSPAAGAEYNIVGDHLRAARAFIDQIKGGRDDG